MSARIAELGGPRNTGPLARWCTSTAARLRGMASLPARPAIPADLTRVFELPERIRVIEAFGGRRVRVTIDETFAPRACLWCRPDRLLMTSVRVWGSPRPDDPCNRAEEPCNPLLSVAVCLRCAIGTLARPGRSARIGALGQALAEARPGAVIRVEVCE